ncbi:MAG: lytic murein transglycosylase B [Gammaproteobacteria bacterium]
MSKPELRGFMDEMVSKHNFQRTELAALFSQAALRPDIIEAISRPAEAKPWHEYRNIFVTEDRIQAGVEFWNSHAADLARAEKSYGVPPEIIVAIIGVETRYGKNTGSYRVLDALSTLAFDYPPRSDFFRGELEQFLLLTREEKIPPLSLTGSYAGAMGLPQFIPSSFRSYAVDFDGDGKRDLWNNTSDAIGSVAHYFSEHGWQMGKAVASPAEVSGEHYLDVLENGLKPVLSIAQLREQGVRVSAPLPADALGSLLQFENESGMEYWVGLQNFYVITRYNHSALYAMAVYQLSQEIRKKQLVAPTHPCVRDIRTSLCSTSDK